VNFREYKRLQLNPFRQALQEIKAFICNHLVVMP